MPIESSHTRGQHLLAASALALAGSLWGTGFLFGKLAMQEMTVSENVAFRFVASAVALIPVVIRYWKPYRGKELMLLLFASIMGIPVQFLIQFQGLKLTTVSHASLTVGVLPILFARPSAIFPHDRFRCCGWGGLGFS